MQWVLLKIISISHLEDFCSKPFRYQLMILSLAVKVSHLPKFMMDYNSNHLNPPSFVKAFLRMNKRYFSQMGIAALRVMLEVFRREASTSLAYLFLV